MSTIGSTSHFRVDMSQLRPLGEGLTSGYAASLSPSPTRGEAVELQAGNSASPAVQIASNANHRQTNHSGCFEKPHHQPLHLGLKLLLVKYDKSRVRTGSSPRQDPPCAVLVKWLLKNGVLISAEAQHGFYVIFLPSPWHRSLISILLKLREVPHIPKATSP